MNERNSLLLEVLKKISEEASAEISDAVSAGRALERIRGIADEAIMTALGPPPVFKLPPEKST